jgi:hypothetical protein
MILRSFAHELSRLHDGREALVKVAEGIGRLYTRGGSIGAAAGLGALGLQKAKHVITGDPYDEPTDTVSGAAIKSGLGGLTAAGIMHLLIKATKAR